MVVVIENQPEKDQLIKWQRILFGLCPAWRVSSCIINALQPAIFLPAKSVLYRKVRIY